VFVFDPKTGNVRPLEPDSVRGAKVELAIVSGASLEAPHLYIKFYGD
jgi:hypothetical protein